ncbi:hypothetical protein [Paenarthrobacter histidinolovorans]|uniref:Uncharacterized protein n=1 Tax=Paenarthrobacter histidinolovorans TaxID=43664 RepID=A0ABW8N064_9MICC
MVFNHATAAIFRSVSTPVQLAVDKFQQRLGRLGQVVGVRGAQLIAMDEDVADPFQFPGGHQRPAGETVA